MGMLISLRGTFTEILAEQEPGNPREIIPAWLIGNSIIRGTKHTRVHSRLYFKQPYTACNAPLIFPTSHGSALLGLTYVVACVYIYASHSVFDGQERFSHRLSLDNPAAVGAFIERRREKRGLDRRLQKRELKRT